MGKNGTWIKLLVVVVIALLAFASGYGLLKGKVSTNTTKIEEVKTEGCIPAREAKTDIKVILGKVETIEKVQEKQDVKLDRILERLP